MPESLGNLVKLAARAREGFVSQWGCAPAVVACAPGRVNLIGEHTDYNDGFVLPMAIDRWCVVASAPGSTRDTRAVVIDTKSRMAFDPAHESWREPGLWRGQGWKPYIVGVLAGFAAREPGAAMHPIDLAITGDVPVGSGLSSSAALEVAVATALEGALEMTLAPRDKALLCQKAEHKFAGVPCGVMDQLAAVFGRAGHALLIDCRTLDIAPAPMPPTSEAVVVVINSGLRHDLASSEYADRRAACESAAYKLGVTALRDAGPHAWHGTSAASLTPNERDAVRHVVSEIARTLDAARALEARDLPRVGRLMHESHVSLRDHYRVSCSELDALVELAMAVPGVHGSRMTGAGFGGCTVTLARPAALPALLEEVPAKYAAQTGREAQAFVVRAAEGARLIQQ